MDKELWRFDVIFSKCSLQELLIVEDVMDVWKDIMQDNWVQHNEIREALKRAKEQEEQKMVKELNKDMERN